MQISSHKFKQIIVLIEKTLSFFTYNPKLYFNLCYTLTSILERKLIMQEKIILGSYTRRESKGIYQITLDTEKKALVNLEHLIAENNPTYLAISAANNLYSMTVVEEDGGMGAYKINTDGTFTFLNAVTAAGAPPCYVAVDNQRNLLYGANYHRGQVTSYKINEDGSIALADMVQHVGSGPHANQTSAHAHYTDLTPDNRLVACDLGTDGVYTYDVSETGKLTDVAVYRAEPGTGPRHLVFHPNGKVAYLFGELANTVSALAYDAATGQFTHLTTLSSLPTDFHEFSGGAAIRVSQDGKFVYASNRGHNSIAVFATSNDGQGLELIQLIPSEGDHPRDFALSNTGDFVVVAHQNTDNLTLFARDQGTGQLSLIEKDVYAPECVCTYFVR